MSGWRNRQTEQAVSWIASSQEFERLVCKQTMELYRRDINRDPDLSDAALDLARMLERTFMIAKEISLAHYKASSVFEALGDVNRIDYLQIAREYLFLARHGDLNEGAV